MTRLNPTLHCSLASLLFLAGCPSPASSPPDAAVANDAAATIDQAKTPVCGDDGGAAIAPGSPILYGSIELAATLRAAGSPECPRVVGADAPEAAPALAAAGVTLDGRAESYALFTLEGRTWIVGRDAVGAMYGELELAERLRLDGSKVLPLAHPILGAPAVPIRAANLFWILPEPGDLNWWYLDPAFWTDYLDLLAHSRINFLDIHGIYNLANTIFPNALLYLARSKSYPNVGADPQSRDRNLAMLNTIIEMAKARGIAVGLMTYRADTTLTGDPPQQLHDDVALKVYTREAVEDLARRAPGLTRVGFRIGESARNALWYLDTFVAGVRASGTKMGVYTRNWGTTKGEVLSIAAKAGSDFLVEAKYNGEQLGAPYVIEGGVMYTNGWKNYSHEDYLEAPAPYGLVFQVRTCSTHRIFRQASFARARRAAATFTMSGAKGFTLEAPHAFFPQRDYYHANPGDRFSPWTFRRDELFYSLLGRLSYDLDTPERVFRAQLAARVGTDGLWESVQAASEIVPWIQQAHTCGPDSRDFAPELEWGGPVKYWSTPAANGMPPAGACYSSYHGPFDSFAVAGPFDTAQDLLAHRPTTRLSSLEVARIVLDDVDRARAAAAVKIDPANAEARDVARECAALADLGAYFGNKLRAATALAVYDGSANPDYLAAARDLTASADDAYAKLAKDTSYIAPFADNLRMSPLGIYPFHWIKQAARLPEDPASIDSTVADVMKQPPNYQGTLPPAADWLKAARTGGPGLVSLTFAPADFAAQQWTITALFNQPLPNDAVVKILYKKFANLADWQGIRAAGAGALYTAEIPGTGDGAQLAVEVSSAMGGWRYPDVTTQTPYALLPPLP